MIVLTGAKTKTMRIRDLPGSTNLGGIKVRTLEGIEGYWCSQWPKGVWLSDNANLSGRMHPIFVTNLDECQDWEVIEQPTKTN